VAVRNVVLGGDRMPGRQGIDRHRHAAAGITP